MTNGFQLQSLNLTQMRPMLIELMT